jgi:hypothetical protein
VKVLTNISPGFKLKGEDKKSIVGPLDPAIFFLVWNWNTTTHWWMMAPHTRKHKGASSNQVWWLIAVTEALGRLRQEDDEFDYVT